MDATPGRSAVDPHDVLVVDDEPGLCLIVGQILGSSGYRVQAVPTCGEAMRVVEDGFDGVVVLDQKLPDGTGQELFERIQSAAPALPVIFLTGYSNLDLALDSIQKGAFDFLDKEAIFDRLLRTVEAAFGRLESEHHAARLRREGRVEVDFREIITQSREMEAVFRVLRNAIDSKVTVLIQGESGTGKELVARAIHENGPRARSRFVALNCAGIPENLLEAELFGYERGAFTGAVARKLGKFELAHHGTLLMDEVGEMHPALQAKVLRVLQEGEYQRLGGVETLHADVRVLSATHRNLGDMVAEGTFRQDLYYRLAVYTVLLPPLRERSGDVPLLVKHFLARASAAEGKRVEGVDPRAMELLQSYAFPGNVRELENIISYAVVSAGSPIITMPDLPPSLLQAVQRARSAGAAGGEIPGAPRAYIPSTASIGGASAPPAPPAPVASVDLVASAAAEGAGGGFPSLDEVERLHIAAALERTGGNKAWAARLLGISRATLYRKVKEYRLGA